LADKRTIFAAAMSCSGDEAGQLGADGLLAGTGRGVGVMGWVLLLDSGFEREITRKWCLSSLLALFAGQMFSSQNTLGITVAKPDARSVADNQ